MIDVVFLLLVFFMLAARFGQDATLPLSNAGDGTQTPDAPILVTVSGGDVALNGVALSQEDLIGRLQASQSSPETPVFVQPDAETSLQQLVDLLDALETSGVDQVVLVPQP